jgi:hypothetical protein
MAAAVSVEVAAEGAKNPSTLEFLKGAPKRLLIGGKWVPARSGKTFEVVNPANEQVIAKVSEGDKKDIAEAVKAARKAFDQGPWPRMKPAERAGYLNKWADLIQKHAEQLAELDTLRSSAGPARNSNLHRYPAKPPTGGNHPWGDSQMWVPPICFLACRSDSRRFPAIRYRPGWKASLFLNNGDAAL